MFIVAITGGIATGKSSVAKVFKENGIPVVDADLIARQSKIIEYVYFWIIKVEPKFSLHSWT